MVGAVDGPAKGVLIPPIWLWFEWRFEGFEHIPAEGPALVACNHISNFDPLAHGYFLVKAGRRPRFLAKIELFRNPISGRCSGAPGRSRSGAGPVNARRWSSARRRFVRARSW